VAKSIKGEKVEKLALTIQRYLSGNPAILIGSGCSVPYGLPSMDDLATEIVKQLDHVYNAEDSWKEFTKQLNSTRNLETALEAVAMKEEIHDAIIQVVWACINQKDNKAFLGFIKNGQYPILSRILKKCVQSIASTSIITTNYDRLVEYSIDAAEGKCVSGFAGNYIKSFQSFDTGTSKRVINLFKVHGSIDWFKHKVNGNTIATNFKDVNDYCDYYYPMIVTPGNGKYRETHKDPFRTVISEADRAIRTSTSYLCIGYGFNDEHIQPIILEENRNKKKPIVIVTKGLTRKMQELFLNTYECQSLIISENAEGGTCVHYGKSETQIFIEPFWQLDSFCKLWLG
jgi:hypothetical protein